MKLKNAYKKAKHGAELYDSRTMEGHIVGMKQGGYRKMPNGGSVILEDYDKTMAPKQGNYLLPDINRPSYVDSEGGRRSEYKAGYNLKDEETGRFQETLLPTVVNGKQLTDDEAIQRYKDTGLHMGKYETPHKSEYASRLRTAKYNMLEDPVRSQNTVFNPPEFKKGGLSKMPFGGITDINSKGDFNYNTSKKIGNVTGSLQGSVNVPTMTSNYMQPKISYDRSGLSAYKTLTGFGAGVRGDKAYIDFNQDQQGKDVYQTGSAGYNSDKINLNANATYKNNVLDNAGIQGNYNVTPNLSLSGNYNVSRDESGMNPNYFAGFRYNKTFKKGGKVDHSNDDDMVNGVASILRRVKDKKNRLQLANQMSSQFNKEKVKYSLNDFLNKSKVKK